MKLLTTITVALFTLSTLADLGDLAAIGKSREVKKVIGSQKVKSIHHKYDLSEIIRFKSEKAQRIYKPGVNKSIYHLETRKCQIDIAIKKYQRKFYPRYCQILFERREGLGTDKGSYQMPLRCRKPKVRTIRRVAITGNSCERTNEPTPIPHPPISNDV